MLQIRDYSQDSDKYAEYVRDSKKLHKCTEDDIMLSRYGYIGQAFTGLAGAYNVALVKVIKLADIENKYLLYYFKSQKFQRYLLDNVGSRATIPGFNKSELKDAKICIPSCDQQKSICRELSTVESIMATRQAQLQKLDKLVKARFVEMFGAYEPCHSIDDACVVLSGFAFKSTHYVDDGIGIMRIANVQKGYIEDKMPCYYPAVDQNAAVNYALREDDLLVSLTGNVGRVGLMTKELLPAALNQRVACLRPKNSNRLDIRYLFALLNLDEFEDAAIEASSGSAQKNLSIKWLKSHRIAIPPSGLQSAFSAFCKQVDKSGFGIAGGACCPQWPYNRHSRSLRMEGLLP